MSAFNRNNNNNNNNNNGGKYVAPRGSDRGGWGNNEPRPSGLASGLPAARQERAPVASASSESSWRTVGEPRNPPPAAAAPVPTPTPAAPVERPSAGDREYFEPRRENNRSNWGNGGGRRGHDAVDDVDDKFARSFAKMTREPAEDARPPREERGFGGERGFGDRDRGERGGFGGERGGGERGGDRGGFGGERGERGGFGGERGERGGFGGERGGERGGFGGERGERGGFGGERGGERGGFGGERGGDRGFGGDRFGNRREREKQADLDVQAVDDKFSRAFSSSSSNNRRDDRGRDDYGGGDARRGSGDVRNMGGRRRDDDDSWKSDSRFAGKFGDRGDRGDRGGRGDRRGGREIDPSRFEGPIPTAPRSNRPNAEDPSKAEEEAKKAEEARLTKEAEEQRLKAEKEAAKAAKKKAEEDARLAKEAAKKAEEEAKNRILNALDNAIAVTTASISAGLKGEALTNDLKTKLPAPIQPAGVLKAILASLNNDYTTSTWYAVEQYGHALKNLFKQSVADHVSLLYAVQAFCAEKKFPKIQLKSGEKRLIEVLFGILIKAEIVDVDGVVAWADDENPLNIPGRMDAIVQTTSMVSTFREALMDDEEEGEYDEDDFKQEQA